MQFKKLAAIAGSAIMAGLTLTGPVLATTINKLEDVPKMVSVTDSTVSFPLFVIGEKAAPSDVAGAIDVAVNMAANAKTTSSVSTTIAGESVTGGAKLATSGIYLTPYANPQNVKGIMTASDIPSLLTGGTYSSASGGSYPYKQYLYLLGQSTNSNNAKITFERPTTENTPRITFKTPGSSVLWSYKMTFSTPVSLSGVTTTALLQTTIQGTTVNLLGKDFIISDCTYGGTTPSGYISDITLLGGKNVLTVETGSPKTVTADSKDYTVTLTGVAAQTIGTSTYYSAIGDINGESFTLKAGETKTLSDGTLVAAIKVFQGKTGAADYATIAIGADKVKLTRGGGTGADSGATGTVTKGSTVISDLASDIVSSESAGWSTLIIKYTPQSDAWLAAGGKVTDPFASTFDIRFNSIIPDFTDTANRQTITFSPSGYNMMLTYKNAADAEKQMYALYYDSTNALWRWASAGAGSPTGQDNNYRDVVFDEGSNISAVEQDYFVIQKGGFSHTMQFTSFINSTKTYTFTDESGNTLTAVGTTTNAANDTADLIVDGNTYKVWLYDDSKRIIHIDLNGDTKIAGYTTGTAATLNTGLYGTTVTGREYSYIVPKLITAGQGGLYFYKGNQSGAMGASNAWVYPGIGLGGIRLVNDTATRVTVGYYNSSGLWTNFSTAVTTSGYTWVSQAYEMPSSAAAGAYVDFIVNATNESYNIAIGSSASAMQQNPGFVLVEEAQQGGTTHNWLFLPVQWDSTNSRTYISSTLYSDDGYYTDLQLLGTSTQYKGVTTYGTLADHLSSNLGGSATINYPDVFTYGNVYVMTPTGTISSGGVGGQVTTEKVLPITSDVVKLDNTELSESDKTNYDLIVVGGPCINKIAAAALDKTFPACGAASGIPENAGLIKLVADKFATGKTVLLIAGWEAKDTDLAARIVQTGFPLATAAQKAASQLTVTGTVASPSYS